MLTRLIRSSVAVTAVAVTAALAVGATPKPTPAASGTPAAASGTPAGASGRTAKQVMDELSAVDKQLAAKHWPEVDQFNPKFRGQMGGEYGPLYERQGQLLLEYGAAVPKAAAATRHLALMDDARLAFWGNDPARGRLDAAVGSDDKAVALDGKVAAAALAWWESAGDADAQAKVVGDVEALVAAAPASGAVADGIHTMLGVTPATVALGQRLTADLTVRLARTPAGKAYAAVPNKIDEPLEIDGTQATGKPFKSSAWAGKVVLVDFWATWCPPCREEIPHVAKVYQQYHDQGLEIIGVSSDNDKRALAAFVKDHPEMPWPELFGSTSGWHPLTKKFGINSIPTMYLIDRNGVLRTMDARSQMDTMVPQLLAEAYTPAPAKAKPAATAAPAPVAATANPTGNVPAGDLHDALRRAASATMH